jgi:hypothetical protein
MYSLRSDQHIWDFEMENPALKVPHVMRAGADPIKSYEDGRVQKIFEKVNRMATALKSHNVERWKMICEYSFTIFTAKENEFVKEMKAFSEAADKKE